MLAQETPARGSPHEPAPARKPQPYPAEKARGAELDLRTLARKIIFFGGLVGMVLLVFLLQFVR